MVSLSAEAEIDKQSKNRLSFFEFLINKFYWYYKRVPWHIKEFNSSNILNSFLITPTLITLLTNFNFYTNSKNSNSFSASFFLSLRLTSFFKQVTQITISSSISMLYGGLKC